MHASRLLGDISTRLSVAPACAEGEWPHEQWPPPDDPHAGRALRVLPPYGELREKGLADAVLLRCDQPSTEFPVLLRAMGAVKVLVTVGQSPAGRGDRGGGVPGRGRTRGGWARASAAPPRGADGTIPRNCTEESTREFIPESVGRTGRKRAVAEKPPRACERLSRRSFRDSPTVFSVGVLEGEVTGQLGCKCRLRPSCRESSE